MLSRPRRIHVHEDIGNSINHASQSPQSAGNVSTDASAPRRTLIKSTLGLGFGVAVAVGSMIGAGILRTPADVAARLPLPSLFLGAWVIGGLYALLGANA